MPFVIKKTSSAIEKLQSCRCLPAYKPQPASVMSCKCGCLEASSKSKKQSVHLKVLCYFDPALQWLLIFCYFKTAVPIFKKKTTHTQKEKKKKKPTGISDTEWGVFAFGQRPKHLIVWGETVAHLKGADAESLLKMDHLTCTARLF